MCSDTFQLGRINLSVHKDSTESQKDEMQLLKQSINNVHGYVHGHIHKHKDHTHIHGHIHSHDVENPNNREVNNLVGDTATNTDITVSEGAGTNEDCPLEDNFCEVLCTELDDCYYSTCGDAEETCDPYNEEETVCTDAACLKDENLTVCCFDESHNESHNNNLCVKNNDRNIFDQIFNEVTKKDFGISDTLSVDDIHYPHELHPFNNTHKAYFHTNILEQNVVGDFGDYDFHFLFDNILNSKDKIQEIEPVTCKWDNCSTSLSTEELIDHIFNEHLSEEQKQVDCEWLGCNHSSFDRSSFISHMNHHKTGSTPSVVLPEVLTPESIDSNINNLQISNVKIDKRTSVDPDYTCLWDVGGAKSCGCKFESAGDLQEHIVNTHIGSGKSSYNCNWIGCDRHNGKNFPQRQKLLRHIHIHTNFKPWKCDVCKAQFAVESMLIQHKRIHSGEKPFKCSICNKKFATSSSLSIHNRVHLGEKPLVCKFPGCNKRFSESSNLTKHMKTHSKNLYCSVCDIHFINANEYLSHLKQHDLPQKMQKLNPSLALNS